MAISKYFKKGSKLFSIFKFKCPHCHEGDFYKSSNPYNFSSMSEANEVCPICQRQILIEPGFYYGAMYISYAQAVGHIIVCLIIKSVFNLDIELMNFVILAGISLLILSPLYFALSKIVWANLFIHYKPKN